ncbi:MAG: hypothetical protein PUF50_03080 [Erysipelotrichaceae bacterium]|nr:hypothetical protein [Erysipelotrichaceae bacterium]
MNKYQEALVVFCEQNTFKDISEDIFEEKYHILKELVDKTIPKKPNLEGDGYWNGELVYDTWVCPSCGKHYEVDYDEYDYCPNCGQAIYWSDEQ